MLTHVLRATFTRKSFSPCEATPSRPLPNAQPPQVDFSPGRVSLRGRKKENNARKPVSTTKLFLQMLISRRRSNCSSKNIRKTKKKNKMLGGNFGPEKKKISPPPPKFLQTPCPPPPLLGNPLHSWDFQQKRPPRMSYDSKTGWAPKCMHHLRPQTLKFELKIADLKLKTTDWSISERATWPTRQHHIRNDAHRFSSSN